MKKYILLFLTAIALLLCSCDKRYLYSGEHMDLAATAFHSIPGSRSSSRDQFLVLDTDEHGRTLFAAINDLSWLIQDIAVESAVVSVMIMQKSDDSYVYFYGEENYIFFVEDNEKNLILTPKFVEENFSSEDITRLKECNDWGKPPEENRRKCVKAPIDLETDLELSRAGRKAVKSNIGDDVVRTVFFRRNPSDQEIVFVPTWSGKAAIWYAIILNHDGTFSGDENAIMKLRGPKYLAEDMRIFMERNNWVDITE